MATSREPYVTDSCFAFALVRARSEYCVRITERTRDWDKKQNDRRRQK